MLPLGKLASRVGGTSSLRDVSRSEREHLRYAHEAVITLRAKGISIEGRTTNVSRGGLCADLEKPIAYGTEVEVDLQLVFDDDVRTEPLRLGARVVWCTTVDDGYQVGLAFKVLDAEKTQLVAVLLKYLDSSGPKLKAPKGERPVDDRFG